MTNNMFSSTDAFDFEGESSSVVSSKCSSQQTSVSSGPLGTGKYRTKRQRLKAAGVAVAAPCLSAQREESSSCDDKVVRFSLSPPESPGGSSTISSLSTMPKRKKRKRKMQTLDENDAVHSCQQEPGGSSSSSIGTMDSIKSRNSTKGYSSLKSLSQRSHRSVRGAGTDVWAMQDAGSFRQLNDDCNYKCSTITSFSNLQQPSNGIVEAACELAMLLSRKRNRGVLFSSAAVTLTHVLDVLASVPPPIASVPDFSQHTELTNEEEASSQQKLPSVLERRNSFRSRDGRDPSQHKKYLLDALAGVCHFLSWDCTTNSDHSSNSSRSSAYGFRKQVLEHDGALKGIALLIMSDPVVNSILGPDATITEGSILMEPSTQSIASEDDARSETTSIASDSVSCVDSINSYENGSNSGSPSRIDPTSAGRRHRRKKRRIQPPNDSLLESIPEGTTNSTFKVQSPPRLRQAEYGTQMSFTSDTSNDISNDSVHHGERICKIRSLLAMEEIQQRRQHKDSCKYMMMPGMNDEALLLDPRISSTIALDAMSRIISGKEGDEVSCMEPEHDGDGNDQNIFDNDNDDTEEQNNPLLITNRLLSESGALLILGGAMTESLQAFLMLLQEDSPCLACLYHLQVRISSLASLLDGACCLSQNNRHELCEGPLVQSILDLLRYTADHTSLHNVNPSELTDANAALNEVALSSIRTLTSLTHDNEFAGEQLTQASGGTTDARIGVVTLAELLYKSACHHESLCSMSSKKWWIQHTYDLIILCLNTMTNVIEAQNVKSLLVECVIEQEKITIEHGEEKGEAFLKWLSRWLVAETTGFRNKLLLGSFGDSSKLKNGNADHYSYLEKQEEEHLVLAGNGFILVACLMVRETCSELKKRIHQLVLGQMPPECEGTTLIRNTLKAFCNFYHYSVGPLSVALVTPVRKLIDELEETNSTSRNVPDGVSQNLSL